MAIPRVMHSRTVTVVCAVQALLCMSAVLASVDTDIMKDMGINALDLFHVWEDGKIVVTVELDMVMTLEEFTHTFSLPNNSREVRNAAKEYLWPSTVIYYDIDPIIDHRKREIANLLREYEMRSCLIFRRSRFENKRLQFKYGKTCRSRVGWRVRDKPQEIQFGRLCWNKVVMLHEIGHALGFYHVHNRPDRDRYIRFNFDVVPQSIVKTHDYKAMSNEIIDTYGIEYDYRSIMHYGKHGQFITIDPAYQKIIGNVRGLSFRDIKLLNIMYNCAERSRCPPKTCPFNGFVLFRMYTSDAFCQCWCDSGDMWNDEPLVLCSKINKDFPAYNLKVASYPEFDDSSRCIDIMSNCTTMREQGVCLTEVTRMNHLCQKTCNGCVKDKDLCMDRDEGCKIMAKSGRCKGQLEYIMKDLCPKSCGVCTKLSTKCDIQKALTGPSP